MALAKRNSPSATEPTVESDAATEPSPSDPASTSDLAGEPGEGADANDQGDLQRLRAEDGPLVPEPGPASPSHLDAELPDDPGQIRTATDSGYTPGVFNMNAPSVDTLTGPAPISNDSTSELAAAGELPPHPANLPDGGNCHIIWPGDPMTVKGHMRGGALVTDCRHYEAYLVNGSRTRWGFKLLYPGGVEIHDRRLAGRVMEANQLRVPAGV